VARAEGIAGARVEQEVARLRLFAYESVIDAVRARTVERLRELAASDEHREMLARLALAAIAGMSGHRFELVLRAPDRERWGEELASQVATTAGNQLRRALQVRLAEDTIAAMGGLMVRGADGHELADQTFEARMERLWPAIRTEVAAMVPEAGGPRTEGEGA
jgi:vacuolar-type H+-ATPase subunit E/Vma4